MADTPFNKITRTTRWQNRILFAMLLLAIFLGGILFWGFHKILDQQQSRMLLNFSALVASLKEQETFLQQLASANRSLRALPDQLNSAFEEVDTYKDSNSRIFQGRDSVGGMMFSLQCFTRIDCSKVPNELFQLGSYLTSNYSSFWARSSFPAAPAFFIRKDGAISIGVPAIDVIIGNESTSEKSFISTIDVVNDYLHAQEEKNEKPFESPWGAPRIAWFGMPDDSERIIGLIPLDFSNLVPHENGLARNEIYATVLFSRNRINSIVRTEHPMPSHQFWLRHRDFGLLMGSPPYPEMDGRGMKYSRDGLILRMDDPSGSWSGYYRLDYAVFFENGMWGPLGSMLLVAVLSVVLGILYNRRFNRSVMVPALDAQREIIESNEFNKALIETAPVAICLVAFGTGKIVFSNSLAQQWLLSADGYLKPESPDNIEALHRVVNAQHAGTMEHIEAAQGKTLHLAFTPTRYMGQKVVLCIFADISARAEMELSLAQAKFAADEANEAKSTFLATMSHEIRTPLYGALGTLELLGMTELSSVQRKYVDRIEYSSTILLQIISDILDTSKIEAGQLQLENSAFNPRELVQGCTSSYAAMAQQNGLLIFSCVDASVPASVIGDPVRIRQILSNLISNAIKFTEAGHVIIRMRNMGDGGGKVRLALEVSDTGVGIDKSLHAELFTPFFLVKNSHRTARGAGLGLSICWRLARMMGSSMQLRSEPGLGSKFWFELALDIVPGATEATPALQGTSMLVRTPHPELTENICDWMRLWGARASPAGRLPVASREDDLLLDVLLQADATAADWQGRHLCASAAGTSTQNSEIDAHNFLSIGFGVLAAVQGAPRMARAEPALPRFALRVLVAEDNPVNQITLRGQLESLGCEVTVADDGAEALAFWDISPHDFVLTDVNMPYVNGYELAEKLRSEGVTCPIIGVTANAMLDEENRCLRAGMNAWLVKPIQLKTLVRTLQKFAPSHAPAEMVAIAGEPTQPAPLEPNVLEVHRSVFMQCMNDDVQVLARSLQERRPDLAIHALHRMRGALLLARLQGFAERTETLERKIHANGLDGHLQEELASTLADLRALLAGL